MMIAIIPARCGSKRIPRKNIREFAGKPMIAWSIEAALASGCFSRVIVSTDNDEIAAVAEAYSAEVPFRRPAQLAVEPYRHHPGHRSRHRLAARARHRGQPALHSGAYPALLWVSGLSG